MIYKLHEVLQLERPLIGLDLETTGKRKKDRIVEISLEIMKPGKDVVEWKSYVNPEMPIPANVTKVHGITDEMVRDAPTFARIAPNLLRGFQNCDFTGFYVNFDLQKLTDEFTRVHLPWTPAGAQVIDAFRIWQLAEQRTLSHAIDRWLKPISTDQELFEALGDGKAHNALWDIKATTRVIAAQLKACGFLPRTVKELHALCRPGWFDDEGKLVWKDGELCFAFGAHRDEPLREVESSYLHWVAGPKSTFSALVKKTCDDALHGIYPTAPSSGEPE